MPCLLTTLQLAKGQLVNVLTLKTLKEIMISLIIIILQVISIIYYLPKPFQVVNLEKDEVALKYWPTYSYA